MPITPPVHIDPAQTYIPVVTEHIRNRDLEGEQFGFYSARAKIFHPTGTLYYIEVPVSYTSTDPAEAEASTLAMMEEHLKLLNMVGPGKNAHSISTPTLDSYGSSFCFQKYDPELKGYKEDLYATFE